MTARSVPSRVVFRCDASRLIGGGHVMRCLALANALAGQGTSVAFVAAMLPEELEHRIASAGHRIHRITPSPEARRPDTNWEEPSLSAVAQRADASSTRAAIGKVDWVVVDHYLLDSVWHTAARDFAKRILVVDDLANRAYDADILLDQTFGRSIAEYRPLVPSGATILTGPTYALLRPEFASQRPAAIERRKISNPVQRILVSMGTGDLGGITAGIVRQALAAAPGCAIDVVLGRQANSLQQVQELAAHDGRVSVLLDSDNMAELMRDADIAVGAAGMTSWERCCLGLPSIVLPLAENQRKGAEALAASDAAIVVDREAEIEQVLSNLIGDAPSLSRMSAAAFAITDAGGTGRVLDAMRSERNCLQVSLRPATLADAEQLWLWRNDPVTRAQSRTRTPVTWPDHIGWLGDLLDRIETRLFVAENSGVRVGTVRFDAVEHGGYEVSISVAPDMRGTGCGTAILNAGCAKMDSSAIFASVREDNAASRRLFEACGFERIQSAEPNFLRYVMNGTDGIAPQGDQP